jgi:serine protease Do
VKLGSPFRLLLLCIAVLCDAAAGAATSVPDFASQRSREEAVVVSITTVSLDSPFILDPDEVPVGEGAAAVARPLAAAFTLRPRRSLASGIIVSADGHIMTSAHAVAAVRDMTVRLADGREFVGRLIGADEFSDVALVKIEAANLPAAHIGDPGRLAVGDWVAAIGAPFGLEASLTVGIVSAKRLLPATGGIRFIQTDVATNPGSSGGPLFNLAGEVVGMSSMMYTSTGGFMGVSFAMPADVAIGIVRQLQAHGRVVRGQLGLGIQELTPALARAFGLSRAGGALVSRVRAGSAAARAGLSIGDVVLGLDDRAEMTYAEIQEDVAGRSPGTTAMLLVWRSGVVRRVLVNVAASVPSPSPATPAPMALPQGDRLGLFVAENPVGGRYAVGEVGPEVKEAHGAALRAGIGPGDQILGLNQSPIRTLAEYDAALARLTAGAVVAVLVAREGRQRYYALEAKGR